MWMNASNTHSSLHDLILCIGLLYGQNITLPNTYSHGVLNQNKTATQILRFKPKQGESIIKTKVEE